MPKKVIHEETQEEVQEKVLIAPITQTFSNGELNVLRDKINELIGS